MADFEHFNKEIPADLLSPVADNSQATPPTEVTTPESGTPPVETVTPPEPQPDKFFEDFNKRYSTQFKTDEDIKGILTLPSKVTEYEGKLKDHDSLTKSVEQYKKELEDTKTTFTSDFLSKPLIKQAFVASQLQEKHPNLDKDILAGLAMTDIDNMDDLEVIARERKMRLPKSSLDAIKAVIKKEVGADPEQKPEEWDALTKTELEMKSADARERIKQLLQGIELPKVVTKEEREQFQAKFLEDKKKQAEPFKEIFKKFDVYKNGDFEFAPPDEFKSKLEDVFNGMFIDSGLELNQENLATAEMIKEALFVKEYLPQMLEVKAKQVKAELQEKVDTELHNDTLPNTATATDQEGAPEESGVSTYLRNPRDERARKF